MLIRDTIEADLPAILAIHNHAIAHTTAIFRDETVDLADREAWFRARKAAGFPVISAVHGATLLGYASYGDFRFGSGYRQTVENSVYVDHRQPRRGIGRALMHALIERARAQKLHVMVAGIGLPNDPSIALHAACGFVETGRMSEVGLKGGRYLDLCLMQLKL